MKQEKMTATLHIKCMCAQTTQKRYHGYTAQNIPVLTSLHSPFTYHVQYSFQSSLMFQSTFSHFCSMLATTLTCSRNWGCESYGNPRYYKALVEE
jgi:hypothetical protein